MSATIIQFPSTASLPYSCDIIKSEKLGFAYVDACVPLGLATRLMSLIATHCEEEVSFSFSQTESNGLGLIDACVPEKIAADFSVLVDSFPTAA